LCKLRTGRFDSSEEMKRSRNRNNSPVAVMASALALALGLIVFAPFKFESAIGARAARSSSSRVALTADRDEHPSGAAPLGTPLVRAPVENSHPLLARTPALQSMANFPLAF